MSIRCWICTGCGNLVDEENNPVTGGDDCGCDQSLALKAEVKRLRGLANELAKAAGSILALSRYAQFGDGPIADALAAYSEAIK